MKNTNVSKPFVDLHTEEQRLIEMNVEKEFLTIKLKRLNGQINRSTKIVNKMKENLKILQNLFVFEDHYK